MCTYLAVACNNTGGHARATVSQLKVRQLGNSPNPPLLQILETDLRLYPDFIF